MRIESFQKIIAALFRHCIPSSYHNVSDQVILNKDFLHLYVSELDLCAVTTVYWAFSATYNSCFQFYGRRWFQLVVCIYRGCEVQYFWQFI